MHLYDPRNVWDFPLESEPVLEPVKPNSRQFELVLELSPLNYIDYHRSEAQAVPILEDNVITRVEIDEEHNDDDDNDDT